MNLSGSICAWQRAIPALALGLVCAGCRPGPEFKDPEPLPPGAVCILRPAVSNELTAAGQAILDEAFPGAAVIAIEDGEAALARCRAEHQVLVVPQVRDLPTGYWPPLTRHLAAGGAVLFWGADPLELRREAGRDGLMRGDEFLERLAEDAGFVPSFSSVQTWRHLAATGVRAGPMRVDLSRSIPWPAVTVEVTNFVSRDALVLDDLPPGLVPPQMSSLAFHARADERITRLVVECDEEDGSHWAALVPVGAAWRLAAVHEAEFFHAWGGVGRGGPGDRLDLSRLRRIAIGLSMHLAPQAPGAHSYAISDVRVFEDPRPPGDVGAWPDIPLLSPPFRRYDLSSSRIEVLASGRRIVLPRVRMQSPLPRPSGRGGTAGAPYRWIPLARAENSSGELLGWPASLYVEPQAGAPARQWAWVGLDPGADHGSAVRHLLHLAAGRLHAGRFLAQAGVDRYLVGPGEAINATARAVYGHAPAAPLRATAELLDARGAVSRRVVAHVPADDPYATGPIDLNLGMVSRAAGRVEDCTIRVSLWDAEGKQLYDTIEQPLRVQPADEKRASAEWLGVTGSGFTLGRRPTMLFGVNYWPLSATGRLPGEYQPHWLNAGVFDLPLIRRDLDRLQDAGINSVAIQYLDEGEAPQLRCFLDEIRARGMWALLYVNHLSPLDQDLDRARALIEAARLQHDPAVFAFDLAWEPRLGREQSRARWDADWRAWLVEQCGSIAHAEQVAGRPLWRRDGEVTGPPDDALARDEGEHRIAVAMYRRFVDDWISRRYGELRRFLASLGCRQLLTARSGYGGSGSTWAEPYFPIDLASGAVHLDFISPEAWGLAGNRASFHEAGFITAYARGVSGGKPAVWLEYGLSVGERPQPQDLANQARVYRHMLDLLINSHAAGGFAWWYPSGFRVDERSDMGIVRPDGEWRPVGDVLRGFNQRLRRDHASPQPWHGREMSRSAHARGLSGLWDEWRAEYRKEVARGRMEEIRPAGFGRFTRDLPTLAVGGAPHADPAPMEYVNAEWGEILVNGIVQPRRPGEPVRLRARQTLRAQLINTGPATWSASAEGQAGTVWLLARSARAKDQLVPLRAVPFGERAPVVWSATDPGRWTLRPLLAGSGSFGEALDVEVAAE